MSEEINYFNPIDLTEEEKQELSAKLANSFVILSNSAKNKLGFPNIRFLRNEFKRNPDIMKHDLEGTKCMHEMISLESKVIRAYIRMGLNLVNKYKRSDKRKDVETIDYLQRCADAIYDAMYSYTGKSKFSTYACQSMINRLSSFVLKEEKLAGIGIPIRNLRYLVKKIMRTNLVNYDEAVKILQEKEKIGKRKLDKLKYSMYEIHDLNLTRHDFHNSEQDNMRIEIQDMKEAIASTEMSPLQRQLIDAYLAGDKQFATVINDSSRVKKITKTVCDYMFRGACEKVQKTYACFGREAA